MTSAFDFPAWAHVLFRSVPSQPSAPDLTIASLITAKPPRQKPGPKPGSKRSKPKEAEVESRR